MKNSSLSTAFILTGCFLTLFTSYAPAMPRDSVDHIAVLRKSAPYNRKSDQNFPAFTYQAASDAHLTALRKTYNLDSVAGKGNEVTRAIRLLQWFHNQVPHEDVRPLKVLTASNIIETYQKTKFAQGCYPLSIAMNEIFLSMGIKSRSVICYSGKFPVPNGGHVINAVYIDSLNKWIYMDPQENAYIKDERGNYLSIAEVRERLIDGRPLVLNATANYHQVPSKKEVYLYQFMAEHMYRMICPLHSEWNSQTHEEGKTLEYVELLPYGSQEPAIDGYETKKHEQYTVISYHTNDDLLFWQKP
ncbi:MAG: transglutaminase domain-containing protein [Bacteroidota bacterium]|nr:transglutaminase domain-containing protein [Bacteroidota bacterium]